METERADNPELSDFPADTGGAEGGADLPPGSHPLEIAARRGIGPLSPQGEEVWHGLTRPCVSCGQLVRRDAVECDQCGQDLGDEMLEKMRTHAGPWYVLEHVRPFPGVTLDRIVRQIRRGLIVETSIVRGPPTDHQWRFAVETPGLSRFFGCCWRCHEEVSPSDTQCRACDACLTFDQPRPAPPVAAASVQVEGERGGASVGGIASRVAESVPPVSQPSHAPAPSPVDGSASRGDAGEELSRLSAVINQAQLPAHDDIWDAPPRIGGFRATWVVAGLLVVVIVALMWLTQFRSNGATRPSPGPSGVVLPVP